MIHAVALVLYVGAFLFWLRFLLAGARGEGPRLASWLAGVGVVAHGAALSHYVLVYGELPLVGLGPALSSLSFSLGIGLIATVLVVRESARVGIVVVPLMVALEGVALAMGVVPAPMALDFQGAWFALHVTLAFVGYQGLALAFAAGLLFLAQFHEIKAKRLGSLFRFLPPLPVLDRVGRVGLWVGFGALTLALALGWAWTVRYRGTFQWTDPKIVWSVVSWLVFVYALWARRSPGGAYKGALAVVTGFGVVVVSFLVVRFTAMGTGLFL